MTRQKEHNFRIIFTGFGYRQPGKSRGRIKALCLRQFSDYCGNLLRPTAAAALRQPQCTWPQCTWPQCTLRRPQCTWPQCTLRPICRRNAAIHAIVHCVTLRGLRCYVDCVVTWIALLIYGAMQVARSAWRKQSAIMRPHYVLGLC